MPYLTARPASLRDFAVPPEATRLKPTEVRFLANSTRPVLSETLNKAEREDVFSSPVAVQDSMFFRAVGWGAFGEGQSRISSHHHLRPRHPRPRLGASFGSRAAAQRRAGASRPAAHPVPQCPPPRGEGASGRGLRCARHRGRARGSPSWPGAMVHARGSGASRAAGQTPRVKGGGAAGGSRSGREGGGTRGHQMGHLTRRPAPRPALLIAGPEIGACGLEGKAGWGSI